MTGLPITRIATGLCLSFAMLVAQRPVMADDLNLSSFEELMPAEVVPIAADDNSELASYQVADSLEEYTNRGYPGDQYLTFYDPPYEPRFAARFGWWGTSNSGARAGVGEWQGLDPSPFFDIDGITSDGSRTLDFFITGTEKNSTDVGLYFYGGPQFSADIDYDRFIHVLGHKPLSGPADANGFPPVGGFFDPPLPNTEDGYVMYGEDLNAGQDYAIRVQTFEADFKGQLTENVSWGLKLWGMKKHGVRQANTTQHCFDASAASGDPGERTCHVVSQGQQIDWLTMEVEPVIKARFRKLSLEYSHTHRSFQQNDETVTKLFRSVSPTYGFQAEGAYALVPENTTDIDRVKLHSEFLPDNHLYMVGHIGNTHNKFRESDRHFYGVDLRWTNRVRDNLTLTTYGKVFSEHNSPDTAALDDRYPGNPLLLEAEPPQTIYNPDTQYIGVAERDDWRVGVKGRWLPYRGQGGWRSTLAVTGGYEYKQLRRDHVTYVLNNLPEFTQPNTNTHMFFVGLQQKFSCSLSGYVRYRFIDNDNPLVGVTHRAQLSLDAAINSNLPEHEDRIEIGGNWTPTDNLLVNASFWIQNTYNHSEFVHFDEDSYPLTLTAWYAPDDKWSFSGGYATFSNWIDQDITLGREDGSSPSELPAYTTNWSYQGVSDVVNLGAAYAWTCDLTLTGGFEYVRGRNYFDTPEAPPSATTDYSDLPPLGAVRVDTYRVSGGVDYAMTDNSLVFFRYNMLDYVDRQRGLLTGSSHMFLGGLSGVY